MLMAFLSSCIYGSILGKSVCSVYKYSAVIKSCNLKNASFCQRIVTFYRHFFAGIVNQGQFALGCSNKIKCISVGYPKIWVCGIVRFDYFFTHSRVFAAKADRNLYEEKAGLRQ
jgi:hypothetical protein